MTISLYSPSQKDGKRSYNFIRTIELEFIPNTGFKFFDEKSKKIYSITEICFTEERISAVVAILDEIRIMPYGMLFSK